MLRSYPVLRSSSERILEKQVYARTSRIQRGVLSLVRAGRKKNATRYSISSFRVLRPLLCALKCDPCLALRLEGPCSGALMGRQRGTHYELRFFFTARASIAREERNERRKGERTHGTVERHEGRMEDRKNGSKERGKKARTARLQIARREERKEGRKDGSTRGRKAGRKEKGQRAG